MELTWLNWLLALLPVLVVLLLMVGFGWGREPRRARPAFLSALVLAVVVFGGDALLAIVAIGKSVFLAADVLYIVWMGAVLLQCDQRSRHGRFDRSQPAAPDTRPRAAQSLLISWIFVSLLQGVGGFGVPVAVVAPLLVGLGYSATQAVIMASLGHGWAVTFGSLGTSFVALDSRYGSAGRAAGA